MSTLYLVGFSTSKVTVTLIEKCFGGVTEMKTQICIAEVCAVGFTNLDITDTVLLKGTMSA